jgi:hypothetical protein
MTISYLGFLAYLGFFGRVGYAVGLSPLIHVVLGLPGIVAASLFQPSPRLSGAALPQ